MIIVYLSGVFDLFHYGHMELISQAREKFPGCRLIIGVHNDKVVTNYKRKPIMTMKERIRSVKASKLADMVIADAPLMETDAFYKLHNIDITAHAHSMDDDETYRKTCCPDAGDKLVRLNYTPTISTSDLISRVLGRRSLCNNVIYK